MRANRTQWAAQTWGQQPGATDQLNADEDAVAALCKHYNVPLISQRAALLDSVATPRHAAPHHARAAPRCTTLRRARAHAALHTPRRAHAARGWVRGLGGRGRSDGPDGAAARSCRGAR